MLKTLFGRHPAGSSHPVSPATRLREMAGSTSADKAAAMLIGPAALMQLSQDDARIVVSYMRPHRIPQGTTFIREGDADKTDFMLLILDGEVTVETIVVSRSEPITLTVLGPGRLIGEMGLLDGEPRSASCTATTDVRGAILTREALGKLLDDDPRTAAKLMMAISLRIAVRLRESTDKLKMYTQLTQAMQQEINRPTVL
ncbi:MAG: cyclic nucleotide-binding domain-containing protein [Burkholderiaceae bacterium]|nr:cyclic nucleotide-binding domain-containing protein [Burkholderiales bacterium]TAL70741.1 MAG: cyclic nucleotide-binding domain-containing protein [Burkholderiaceae bacterium]TBR77190.1 MAG: cyclic nucleotide-binding domain-containing protein [Burkholderiaceae bacterium]